MTVSRGPLLRVEGQPLSIRCDVSEYEGPREQDFEWTVTRGTETITVISTFDDRFTDRSLQDRIRSGDISVSRLEDNAVELRIQEARVRDSATYRCSTPSTDSVISGNYDADVQLQGQYVLFYMVERCLLQYKCIMNVHKIRFNMRYCSIVSQVTESTFIQRLDHKQCIFQGVYIVFNSKWKTFYALQLLIYMTVRIGYENDIIVVYV